MIRAVIDTNILVSALIAPAGNEALIVLAIKQGWVKPYYSAEILEEYAGVLARRKFRFRADEIDGLIALVRSSGKQVHTTGPIHGIGSPDPGDQKFLANAAELLDKMTLEI